MRGRRISAGRAARALALVLALAGAEAAQAEPRLEYGFPVEAWSDSGGWHQGTTLPITVGNLDRDPEPEILATGTAAGPLYAWNGDGTRVPGWPGRDVETVVWPTLGQLSKQSPAFEVAGTEAGGKLWAWDRDGRVLPGWPRLASLQVAGTPMLADVDGDGLDESFSVDDARTLVARAPDGHQLWARSALDTNDGGASPAAADLDGDGELEIVWVRDTVVDAHHHDGTQVAGFPVSTGYQRFFATTPASVGDVDGDGSEEIVVVQVHRVDDKASGVVVVVGPGGDIERALPVPVSTYATGVALADLTGDGTPEIVVQGDGGLTALRGNGDVLPGFPVSWSEDDPMTSEPVVGDVDGDQSPDIVVETGDDPHGTQLRVYRSDGSLLPGFPLATPAALIPAIADIDGDGRNEIIVAGQEDSYTGDQPALRAYDLGGGPHGKIEWGQSGGGPQHQRRYGAPTEPALPLPASGRPAGARRVADIWSGTGSSDPGRPAVLGRRAVFAAGTAGRGRELWTSDGTAAGTALLREIRPGAKGSDPQQLVRVGDAAYFTADDGVHGRELWRTDGTAAGTRLVKDVRPGPAGSFPLGLTAIGARLWFSGSDGVTGYEPWVSDGTTTRMVADVAPGDGTTPGGSGEGSGPVGFTSWRGKVYFRALGFEPTFGQKLFESDGTAAGTRAGARLVWARNPWTPFELTATPEHLFFDVQRGAARSDGSQGGTEWDRGDLEAEAQIDDLTTIGDVAWFAGASFGSPAGRRLFRWAGNGAPQAIDVWSDGDASPRDLTPFGDRLLFVAADEHGIEPWIAGGAAQALGDLRPGPRGSDPHLLAAFGHATAVLSADDGSTGDELWATDGTPAGTRRLTDLAPGPRGAAVRWAARVGDNVLLSADDGSTGQELWALDPPPALPPEPAPKPKPSPSPATPASTPPPGPGPAPAAPQPRLRLLSVRLSRTTIRRGRRLVVRVRASRHGSATLTLRRRGSAHVRLRRRLTVGPRAIRVHIATRALKPGRYVLTVKPTGSSTGFRRQLRVKR